MSLKTSGQQARTAALTWGRRPALRMASLMTSAPISTVRTSLSDPPKLPTAVLAPLTMTTSLMTIRLLSHPDQHRIALGGAGADAADAQAAASPPELVGEGHQDPCPRRSDGVAVGDRAAVHVDLLEHLLLRHPQDRPGADEDHRGEGLVDLDQFDAVEGQ